MLNPWLKADTAENRAQILLWALFELEIECSPDANDRDKHPQALCLVNDRYLRGYSQYYFRIGNGRADR